LNDNFLRNNVIFFIGSMSVAFLNYLYYPVMTRLVDLETFGEIQTLISILTQITVVTSVFGIVAVNITSHDKDDSKKALVSKIEKVSIIFMLAIFFLLVILSPSLKENLQFASISPFFILAILLPLSAIFAFRVAYLQGQHEFKSLSIANLIFALLKLLLGVLAVITLASTFRAMIGILIAQTLAIAYALKKTIARLPLFKLDLRKIRASRLKLLDRELVKELKYGSFIFLILFSVTIFYTFDIIVIKKFFSPTEAGLYSGIATVSRIIFFANMSVSGVLLPSVKITNSKSENHKLLLKSLIIMSIISLPILLVFALFPEQILSLLIGHKYTAFASLLPYLSVSVILASFINLLFYYFIALRKYTIIIPAIAGLMGILLLSYLSHTTINIVVYNFIIVNFIIAFALILFLFDAKKVKARFKHGATNHA